MKNIALLGSTGSVGKQVLNVVRRNPQLFNVVSLAAGHSAEIKNQTAEFRPLVATVEDKDVAAAIKSDAALSSTRVFCENDAYLEAIIAEADVVVVALSGFVGLKAVLRAIELKKDVALANKESLVAGGELIMPLAVKNGVKIIPVDSEHSAIYQCLNFKLNASFEKILLTASGGPFKGYSEDKLADVTAKEAINHPVWKMGAKISVDCANLMNKGFEVIEACRLFNCPPEKIEVIIHPQSVIHSMVQFTDGAVLAQMGTPNMETVIQVALTSPNRTYSPLERLDFAKISKLEFLPLDEKKYPCYSLAMAAIKEDGNLPCALSAADEQAVSLFLKNKIKFTDIPIYIERCLERTERLKVTDYRVLEETDRAARRYVLEEYQKRDGKI